MPMQTWRICCSRLTSNRRLLLSRISLGLVVIFIYGSTNLDHQLRIEFAQVAKALPKWRRAASTAVLNGAWTPGSNRRCATGSVMLLNLCYQQRFWPLSRKSPTQTFQTQTSRTSNAAVRYYDGYTTGRLPHNLLQAQRDYFGAHT
jgi:hypothetical protein